MKITLVRPPFYSFYLPSGGVHPLNIGYLVSSLKQAGFSTSFLDGEMIDFPSKPKFKFLDKLRNVFRGPWLVEKNEEFLDEVMSYKYHKVWNRFTDLIKDTSPNLVGISTYTSTMASTKIICERLKEKIPEVPIVLGGIHPTSRPRETLEKTEADYVIFGEGEQTMLELAEFLRNGVGSLKNIDGLGWKNDEVNLNRSRSLIEDLDSLPFPEREFENGYNYSSHTVMTSRGCPFNCGFCASENIWGRKVRERSIQDVIMELKELRELGMNRVEITDDTFTLSKDRVIKWCDMVKENDLSELSYRVGSRADTIDEEMVRNLKTAGVDTITIGIESASSRIQKEINKNLDLERALENVSMINDYGVTIHCFFMIGHPTETKKDVEKSLKLMEKMGDLSNVELDLNVVCPYPQTMYGKYAQKVKKLTVEDYYKMFHQAEPVINLTDMDYEEYKEAVYKLQNVEKRKNFDNQVRTVINRFLSDPIEVVSRATK